MYVTRRTSHASLVKRGEGKQWRINCCSILQQQLHTLQATSCTGVTQRSAAIDVTSIHLEGTEPQSSPKYTNLSIMHWWRKPSTFVAHHWHHLTCAPAFSSSLTHWVCPCIHASCRGVMESTATMLTAAPPSISFCSWRARPWAAASCTADRSVQNPRPWAANMWSQTRSGFLGVRVLTCDSQNSLFKLS